MSKNVFGVVARLPQRLKSTFFEKFSSLHWPLRDPSGPVCSKKNSKTLILAFEADNAFSCENETKILKITHSADLCPGWAPYFFFVRACFIDGSINSQTSCCKIRKECNLRKSYCVLAFTPKGLKC